MTPDAILVGLDPGASGGIAWTKPGVGVVAVKMPEDFAGIAALANEIRFQASLGGRTPGSLLEAIPVVVYCEQVTGYVAPAKGESVKCPDCEGSGQYLGGACEGCAGIGRVGRENRQPGHAMFTFGKNTGAAIMAFTMIGARIVEVPPKTWQAPLFIKKSGATKTVWKNQLKAQAQRLFPGVQVTLKTADALLLLWFAKLKECPGRVLVAGNPQRQQGANPGRKATARKRPPKESQALRGKPWVASVLGDHAGAAGIAGTFGNCACCKAPFFDRGAPIPWHISGRMVDLCSTCSDAQSKPQHRDPKNGRLYVGEWRGAKFVFRQTTAGNGWIIERAAKPDDVSRLPQKPTP